MMNTREARKFLNNEFTKNPKPSMEDMKKFALLLSVDEKKVYRYFINKRANAKRNENLKLEKEVPTLSVEKFFQYWEKEITEGNESLKTNDEWYCYGCDGDGCSQEIQHHGFLCHSDIRLSQEEWGELEALFDKLSRLTELDESSTGSC